MVERERGTGRPLDEDVAHPAGFEPVAEGVELEPPTDAAAEEAMYRRQMAVGIGVQSDFEEALAALAK